MAELDPTEIVADAGPPTELPDNLGNPYILATSEPFSFVGAARTSVQAPIPVRRPAIGLTSPTARFCTIDVIARSSTDGNGEPISLINSSYVAGQGRGTTNFFIQTLTESPGTTSQVVKSFSSWFMSSVGVAPDMIEVSGILLQSVNFNWRAEWDANFKRFLRSDQCILRKAQVFLTIEDRVFSGYIINSVTSSSSATTRAASQFTFTMAVRNTLDLSLVNINTAGDASLGDSYAAPVDPTVLVGSDDHDYNKFTEASLNWARFHEMVVPEEGTNQIVSNYTADLSLGNDTSLPTPSRIAFEEYLGRFDITKYMPSTDPAVSDVPDDELEGGKEVMSAVEEVTDSGSPSAVVM